MPDDRPPHLEPRDVMRAAEHALEDPIADRHLQTCPECRATVEEWRAARREFAALRDMPELEDSSLCPEAGELARFGAGGEADRERILEHVARCRRCAAIATAALDSDPLPSPLLLTSSSAQWRRAMAERFSALRPRRRTFRRLLPIAAALVLAAGGLIWRASQHRQTPGTLLARAYTAARPFPYWMPDAGYSAVRQQRGPASQIDKPTPLLDAEAAARRLVASQPDDPRALAFKGQVQLLELEYDAAIESLTRASELLPRDPNILGALATAYAARGGASDLVHALDLYLQTLKLEPGSPRIQFNLALLYEQQSMIEQAIAACRNVLGSAISDPWRREAEDLLKRLLERQRSKNKADAAVLDDPARFLASYGAGAPFDPLEYVDTFWSRWLPESRAGPARSAAALVAARMRVRFSDPSLQSILARVTAAQSWAAVGLLAESIRENRAGNARKALETAPEAVATLDREGLPAAGNRARVELAYALRWAGRYAECLAVTERVKSQTPRNQAWLLNQARLERSSCAAGVGQFDEARQEIHVAYEESSRVGLWPLALRAAGFLTALDGYTGNFASVWDPAFRGLAAYWATSASVYRAQNFEFDLYKAAKFAGLRSAALVFYRAVMDCSRAAGNREMEAQDRFGIAALLHENGDLQAELQELQAARQLLGEMDGGSDVVDNLRWEARLRIAEAQAGAHPTEALRNLQGLEERTARRTLAQQMRLWQARGLALVASSEARAAADAFRKAIALNQDQAGSVRSWLERMPVLDLAAASYRGLTQIEIKTQSDPASALKTWQQYRTGGGFTSGPEITMAVLPRGIAVWRTGRGPATVRWASPSLDAILGLTEEMRRLCASPASDPARIRDLGAKLYRALLAPELRSVSPGVVRINADSWLAAIPLAALTDESGAYLGRKWSFIESYGPRPRSGTAASTEPIVPRSSALIVVAPSARLPGGRELTSLTAAIPEAQDVAGHFAAGIVKESPAAERLKDLAAEVEVFHFVGHGWANGGGGALLLGSSPVGGGFLTAPALAALDWSRCRLAVLSACLTAAGLERGMVNNQSLVQALLSGGAHRVVASRWSIDSEATRRLMEGFYDALLRGASPSEALTVGANAVSERASWRHPYYWAAFEVFGLS